MANQPPPRPWFRLQNLTRPQQPQAPPAPLPAPAPTPSPAPQPTRVPIARPPFRPAFTQAQPALPPPPPPRPSQPPSPPPPMRTASPSPSPSPSPPPPSLPPSTRISPVSTPKASPKSPPVKTSPSPPPMKLPPPINPALPEAEQEKVLLQDTFNKKPSNQATPAAAFAHTNNSRAKAAAAHKPPSSDSEDTKNVKIITMTGDNKGALMELGFPSRRNAAKALGSFPGSGYKLGNATKEDEDVDSANADRSEVKDRDKLMETTSRRPMSGYVNSNVQGINNSILYNCSFAHHDPGVHFSVSRKKPANAKARHGNGHDHGNRV